MPAKTVESQRSFHKYCVSSIKDRIKNITTNEKLQCDGFLDGKKETQQLLSELEKTNEFLLLNLDELQHCQFLDETLAIKRDSRKKLNMNRRKFKISCDLVNNSADTKIRLPTRIQQQKQRNEAEQREITQETLSASTGITLSSIQPTTLQNLENSKLPFHAICTRNLFDQNTFPYQHQPSFTLANSQDHTERQQFFTTPIQSRSLPTLKLDTFIGHPLIWTDWIQLFESAIVLRPLSTTEKMTH